MIAPTNCNPYCDCAQRLVRCERAEQSGAAAYDVNKYEAEAVSIAHRRFGIEPPPFVIPASLGVQKRTPLSDIPADQLLDTLRNVEVAYEFSPSESNSGPMTVTAQYPGAWGPMHMVIYDRTDLRIRIVKAFQASDFDLADWNEDFLRELADIVIGALETSEGCDCAIKQAQAEVGKPHGGPLA